MKPSAGQLRRVRPVLGTFAITALLAVPARSQDGFEQRPGSSEQRTILVEERYGEPRSLALFAACDRDSDDRLDVFEIRSAMVDLRDTRDASVFRRLDADSSGFLEWNEFDERFRTLVQRSGSFRVRPVHEPVPLRDPTVPVAEMDPTATVLRAVDTDGDGGLAASEFAAFLRKHADNDGLARHFDTLDLDRSGLLDEHEFAPVLQWVPDVFDQLIAAREDDRSAIPPDHRAADRNLDGVIDRDELRAALALLDPSLKRWTDRILTRADRTRNGTLGGAELTAASAATAAALDDAR